jgi:hypothetical protein
VAIRAPCCQKWFDVSLGPVGVREGRSWAVGVLAAIEVRKSGPHNKSEAAARAART